MIFINVYNGDKCIAEISGDVIEITDKCLVINTNPEEVFEIFTVISNIKGSCFINNNLMFPLECIKYMSNYYSEETKIHIRLI